MSLNPRTCAELAEIFPPVPATSRTARPTGILPAADATIGTLFVILHRELFGKRYRRTAQAAGSLRG